MVATLAGRLAEEAGTRLLLIKGQPATDLGVRAERPSIDVDVWVDPVRWRDYCTLLELAGWSRLPSLPAGVGWDHAVTMTHPAWPASVDVHRCFPGFLADESVVFDLVWQGRDHTSIAGDPIAVPGVVAAAVITVLHAERSIATQEPQDDAAVALQRAKSFTTAQVEALNSLVLEAGASATAANLLDTVGIEPTVATAEHQEALAEWRLRQAHREQLAIGWALALRRARWRDRPRLVVAALRPTDMDYTNAGAVKDTLRGRFVASIRRWRRGARVFASVFRSLAG